jgi:hypothetical protein
MAVSDCHGRRILDGHDLYALDPTTIDLCLLLFPWDKFRKHKGAVKMHKLLDLHGSIPTFIHITVGNVAEVNVLDKIDLEAGAFYTMDCGYIYFERLDRFTLELVFFVGALRRAYYFSCTIMQQVLRTSIRTDR